MKVYGYIALLFNAVTFVSLHENKCPSGEIYKECGSACPPTCSNPSPTICTYNCVQGCFCPDDKFRDENTGKCVDLTSCTCPEGEEFNECGTACPITCENPKVEACTKQCVLGCFCKKGKIRQESTGECVDAKDCIRCHEYEEYTNNCVSAATCEHPHLKTCLRKNGCTCKKGLIRDTEIDECVPIEECPQTEPTECINGEVYKKCGPGCLATCSDPQPANCTEPCRSGCFCPENQVRNDFDDYKCINQSDCPIQD